MKLSNETRKILLIVTLVAAFVAALLLCGCKKEKEIFYRDLDGEHLTGRAWYDPAQAWYVTFYETPSRDYMIVNATDTVEYLKYHAGGLMQLIFTGPEDHILLVNTLSNHNLQGNYFKYDTIINGQLVHGSGFYGELKMHR